MHMEQPGSNRGSHAAGRREEGGMMLNNHNDFSYSINAVSGTLRKSHPKSRICIKKLSDNMCIFSDDTRLTAYGDKIVVLQVMLIGDGTGLIEYVRAAEFEEVHND